MAQIKKEETRQAILRAAHELFATHGYHHTSLRQIAKKARMSLANVYVYYPTKYKLLFAVYDPWMKTRMERLEQEALAIKDRRERLRHIVMTLWHAIPTEQNGFARNIMQALSTLASQEEYDSTMIRWAEDRLTTLLRGCLTGRRRTLAANGSLAHLMMMAFDGFAINTGLNPAAACNDKVIDFMCGALQSR
jgi:AcrR family transcriptional regulator